ncbi:hypothetical protein [Thaumasiovibrio sp. DFM-14]|uniref:hypothetical protein n=1 Tax=Thaumasiovibrio sp. DFM-14 TaxID=3384792 RepID=UPI0039A06B8B
MDGRRLLFDLQPIGWGTTQIEPLDTWMVRCRYVLPHFPDDVLEQWLYQHWAAVFARWGGLAWTQLRFVKVSWSFEQIESLIQIPYHETLTRLSRRMQRISYQDDSLNCYFRELLTWPRPPIIYWHQHGFYLDDGHYIHPGYNLIEGYHRFAALYAMLAASAISAKQQHVLWLCRQKNTQQKGPLPRAFTKGL